VPAIPAMPIHFSQNTLYLMGKLHDLKQREKVASKWLAV